MNIHPIIVHFPIALLASYAFFEFLRFKKLQEWQTWFYIKFMFLVLGFLGALAAAYTGDFGRPLFPAEQTIISLHEMFAKTTIILFGVIGIYYGIEFLRRSSIGSMFFSRFLHVERFLLAIHRLYSVPTLIFLALVGLVGLIITGALGASIVYGAGSDPFISFVYQMLGLNQ